MFYSPPLIMVLNYVRVKSKENIGNINVTVSYAKTSVRRKFHVSFKSIRFTPNKQTTEQ